MFKDMFKGFWDEWQWKLLIGMLYLMMTFLVLCLIYVVFASIPLVSIGVLIIILLSITVGHFVLRREK